MNLTQEQLEDEILYHKYLYYKKAEPIISDYNYDQLEKELKRIAPDSKLLSEAIYNECPPELWSKYEERYRKENNI